jgi:hypothetical protein
VPDFSLEVIAISEKTGNWISASLAQFAVDCVFQEYDSKQDSKFIW